MHNRARLVVGSFLTKDLHLDWRHGEAHFEALLLDGEPAQNNGNWQWVTSVGVDPAPYFRRLFNPVLQQRKFDPDGDYVRRWVPELRDVPDDAAGGAVDDERRRAAGGGLRHRPRLPGADRRARRRAPARDRALPGGGGLGVALEAASTESRGAEPSATFGGRGLARCPQRWIADDLYGLPFDQFVSERTALAKALRKSGEREQASKVAALRKPSIAAWAVNQLVRTQHDAIAELYAAGDGLRDAQADLLAGRGDGRTLRAAGDAERAAVRGLVETARGLLSSDGHELSETVVERVADTLHAAALDENLREQVREGRLERELRHVGLGLGEAPAAAAAKAPAKKPAAKPKAAAKGKAGDGAAKPTAEERAAERAAERERLAAERAEQERVQRERDEARKAARVAESAARRRAERAARALSNAQERRDRAAETLAGAEEELADAREEAEEAAAEHARAQAELSAL